MTTRNLVDPELLPALKTAPSFGDMTETLHDIRAAMAGVVISAPAARSTTVEQRFIPGPGSVPVRILVYTADEVRPPAGCLLWFHGGGMVMGTPEQNDPLCRYLAQTTGCVVVAVQYRLSPENPYPAGLQDGHAALRWCHSVADELGYPHARIAVAGESGGGCIAAGLTLWARDRHDFPVSAQFLLYPMLDDRTGTPAEPHPMPYTGEFVWTRDSNRFAWAAVLGESAGGPSVDAYAAPGRADDLANLPPTSIFIGSLDLFIAENVRYARSLIRHGVNTALHVYPGAYHAFISFAQEADVSQRGFQDFTSAITRHFARPSSASPAGSTSWEN